MCGLGGPSLARWRIPQRGDRSMIASGSNDRRLTPLANALEAYLDESGLGESLARLGAIDKWPDAVGPHVARVTKAVEVRGDTLVVEVLSSAWINELSMMGRMILEQLNDCWSGPALSRVRFRLAETAEDAVPSLAVESAGRRIPIAGRKTR